MKNQELKQLIKECLNEINQEQREKKLNSLVILGKKHIDIAKKLAKKEFGI